MARNYRIGCKRVLARFLRASGWWHSLRIRRRSKTWRKPPRIYSPSTGTTFHRSLGFPAKARIRGFRGNVSLIFSALWAEKESEFNAPCASYTAPRALIESGYLKTDIAYASIFPPSADFYDQNPEAQHFAASSFPSREITRSQEQYAGIEGSNVSVEYDNIGEMQGFSGICKVPASDGLKFIWNYRVSLIKMREFLRSRRSAVDSRTSIYLMIFTGWSPDQLTHSESRQFGRCQIFSFAIS